jgi:hypothetical protein
MSKPVFTSKDTEKIVEFLNFIGTNARFSDLGVKQAISLTKMLNYMQTELLPKVDAHILEVLEVREFNNKNKDKSK